MKPSDDASIRHRAEAGRYEIEVGDQLAVLDYRRDGDKIIFTHTFVPPEFRNRGLAEKLVRHALDDAREQKIKIVPVCSYVAWFIRRHPEYQPLLAAAELPRP